MIPRCFLFVPADSQRKFEHATGSAAEALILDLEDSIPAPGKAMARKQVREMLASIPARQQAWVRVNALDTGLLLDDLCAVIGSKLFGIILPKCDGRETLQQVSHYLDALERQAGVPPGQTRIMIIATETARSMFGLGGYASVSPRLWGITWGGEDLAADIGSLENRRLDQYTEPYRLARAMCLYAAAAAGVYAVDAVCVQFTREDILEKEATEAFQDGFSGKLSIHPRQIASINQAFTASVEQLAWARRIIDAFEQAPGTGAFSLDGEMIDRPHLRLARRICGS